MQHRNLFATVAVAVMVAAAAPAFASGNGNSNGNGNNPTTYDNRDYSQDNRDYSQDNRDYRTTNNNDNRDYSVDNRIGLQTNDNRITNNLDLSRDNTANGGAGGAGGQGGAGGSATGGTGGSVGPINVGGAINNAGDVKTDVKNTANGGSVLGSGNSANSVKGGDVKIGDTTNTLGQGQDQDQAQKQGQQQGIDRSGNSSSDSNVDRSGNSTVGVGVDVAGNNASLTGGAINISGDTVTYETATIPVAGAYAAPSVVGGGVCAYTPFSAGIQLLKFGGSAQGAIIDQGCEDRANADVLARLGLKQEAVALIGMNKRVAEAFRVAAAQAQQTAKANNTPVAVAAAPVPAATVAVQDQKVGAIMAQGVLDPKKGYRILHPSAQTSAQ